MKGRETPSYSHTAARYVEHARTWEFDEDRSRWEQILEVLVARKPPPRRCAVGGHGRFELDTSQHRGEIVARYRTEQLEAAAGSATVPPSTRSR
jgi:hypothetical protein